MYKFRFALRQFMKGRYGTDPLYYALLVLYLILLVFHMVLRRIPAANLTLNLLSLAVILFAFYRVFSRNINRRSAENDAFLRLWDKVRSGAGSSAAGGYGRSYSAPVGSHSFGQDIGNVMTRIKDFPTKKYTKCPHCHATLRLPRQRGKHTVRCPRCGQRFPLTIRIGSKPPTK